MPPSPLDAAAALARSGLMALTGWPDRAPVLPPLGLPAGLVRLTGEIEQRTRAHGRPVRVSWEAALAGRAAWLGLGRQGRTSANGSCRLLPTRDGWMALNLPRPDDLELLPALTGRPVADVWSDTAAAAARASTEAFVAQARLLGLAASPLGTPRPGSPPWTAEQHWPPAKPTFAASRRVIDLSSLWAGPVVGRILAEAGAEVTKLESAARPDAARSNPAFYHWVHGAGQTSVQVDLASPAGRERAAGLIDDADVVIEASRPRALEQLGLGPLDRPARPGRVWLSVTAHGRRAPGGDWVGFGDDAAVAGGLVGRDAAGDPVFCGDAIADPIVGLAGAVAVLRALDAGGGQLIDLALSTAAAALAGEPAPARDERHPPIAIEGDGAGGWVLRSGARVEAVRPGPPQVEWIEGG